jgi:hypothetical protein
VIKHIKGIKQVSYSQLEVRVNHKDKGYPGTDRVQNSMLAREIYRLFNVEKKLMVFGVENPLDEAIAHTLQGLHYHTQLVRLLDSWRLQWEGQTDQIIGCAVHAGIPANRECTEEFLEFLRMEAIIPIAVDLTAMFFLCSESNFIHHWALWIHLQLENKGASSALLQASP